MYECIQTTGKIIFTCTYFFWRYTTMSWFVVGRKAAEKFWLLIDRQVHIKCKESQEILYNPGLGNIRNCRKHGQNIQLELANIWNHIKYGYLEIFLVSDLLNLADYGKTLITYL